MPGRAAIMRRTGGQKAPAPAPGPFGCPARWPGCSRHRKKPPCRRVRLQVLQVFDDEPDHHDETDQRKHADTLLPRAGCWPVVILASLATIRRSGLFYVT